MDPRQMIMQMLMAQQGGGGQGMPQGMPRGMPQGTPPEPPPSETDIPDVQGPPDERFGPVDDPARDQTEGELAAVSESMNPKDEGLSVMVEELRAALESGDDEAVQELLGQMEEAGISIDDLPPDIRDQIDTGEGEVSTPAEEDGEVE